MPAPPCSYRGLEPQSTLTGARTSNSRHWSFSIWGRALLERPRTTARMSESQAPVDHIHLPSLRLRSFSCLHGTRFSTTVFVKCNIAAVAPFTAFRHANAQLYAQLTHSNAVLQDPGSLLRMYLPSLRTFRKISSLASSRAITPPQSLPIYKQAQTLVVCYNMSREATLSQLCAPSRWPRALQLNVALPVA